MIKYLLTAKCNRSCSYCITRNIRQKESEDMWEIGSVLARANFLEQDPDIMITGGEPTLAKYFVEKVRIAKLHFKNVYMTSQNPEVLKPLCGKLLKPYIKAITFSLHTEIANPPKVEHDIKVYASILDNQFHFDLPNILHELGYAGLTINEEQRNGGHFELDQEDYNEILDNFSIKINRRGHCLKGMTMILPDLTVIKNFEEYL